jgi:hypothetical protein
VFVTVLTAYNLCFNGVNIIIHHVIRFVTKKHLLVRVCASSYRENALAQIIILMHLMLFKGVKHCSTTQSSTSSTITTSG